MEGKRASGRLRERYHRSELAALNRLWCLCFAAGLVSACDEQSPAPEKVEQSAVAAAEPKRARFDAAAVEAAKAKLLEETRVVDVLYQPEPTLVTWQIGTLGVEKPAYGYAEYVCSILAELKLVDADTSVRIVDLANAEAQAGDFRAGSLGQVQCADGVRLFP